MPNALTRDIGFKVGPLLLEVLAKHYRKSDGEDGEGVKLRKNEILFDEAFNIVKVSKSLLQPDPDAHPFPSLS
jgi:hypothetical protein